VVDRSVLNQPVPITIASDMQYVKCNDAMRNEKTLHCGIYSALISHIWLKMVVAFGFLV
jgi:hypothetical protein